MAHGTLPPLRDRADGRPKLGRQSFWQLDLVRMPFLILSTHYLLSYIVLVNIVNTNIIPIVNKLATNKQYKYCGDCWQFNLETALQDFWLAFESARSSESVHAYMHTFVHTHIHVNLSLSRRMVMHGYTYLVISIDMPTCIHTCI